MDLLNVSLLGCGTVGSGVAEILLEQADRLTARGGRPIRLRHVAVRNPSKPRSCQLPDGLVHARFEDAVTDPEVDLVVELIGGLDPAEGYVRAALEAGKDVVSANKALLCERGRELFPLAARAGRTIGFEAAVAGGIPIISALSSGLAANQIRAIEAILNGTSNFILTRMLSGGLSYDAALAEAQARGYAEADPTMDVDGTDAAQKLTLLGLLAFGSHYPPSQYTRIGIDGLDLSDLRYADELGYAVKLVATARLSAGQVEMHVRPTLVSRERPLAQVDGSENMIAVEGDAVGMTWFAGPGAGRMPTASAVVADILDVASGRAATTFRTLPLAGKSDLPMAPPEELRRRFYIRFQVEDRPHVLADIADVLGRHEISLASVMQHEAPEGSAAEAEASVVPLVVMTHRASEGRCRAAEAELEQIAALRSGWVRMPVAD